jgi:hypothetical protein
MDFSALVSNVAIAIGLAALVGSLAQCLGALTARSAAPIRLRPGGAILATQPAR